MIKKNNKYSTNQLRYEFAYARGWSLGRPSKTKTFGLIWVKTL